PTEFGGPITGPGWVDYKRKLSSCNKNSQVNKHYSYNMKRSLSDDLTDAQNTESLELYTPNSTRTIFAQDVPAISVEVCVGLGRVKFDLPAELWVHIIHAISSDTGAISTCFSPDLYLWPVAHVSKGLFLLVRRWSATLTVDQLFERCERGLRPDSELATIRSHVRSRIGA